MVRVSLATPPWITRPWITRIAVCHGACGAALIGRNSMGTGAETDTGWVSYDQPLSGRRRCSRGVCFRPGFRGRQALSERYAPSHRHTSPGSRLQAKHRHHRRGLRCRSARAWLHPWPGSGAARWRATRHSYGEVTPIKHIRPTRAIKLRERHQLTTPNTTGQPRPVDTENPAHRGGPDELLTPNNARLRRKRCLFRHVCHYWALINKLQACSSACRT